MTDILLTIVLITAALQLILWVLLVYALKETVPRKRKTTRLYRVSWCKWVRVDITDQFLGKNLETYGVEDVHKTRIGFRNSRSQAYHEEPYKQFLSHYTRITK